MTAPEELPGGREFTWRDGERRVFFRPGILTEAPAVLGGEGWQRYELLTTERALGDAPLALAEDARRVHEVPPGRVAELAAGILDAVTTPTLVALGGGRVIDTAKAIAAVRGGRVAAIPTTLSGAEMTRIHRLPAGHAAPHLVRPALVLADPRAMTTLPETALRASAMNALAHGAEPLYTPLANPVGSLASLRGAELVAEGLDAAGAEPADLALGSLLCAYALDCGGYALHHVVCQTLVWILGTPHAETNAAMLPHTLAAMTTRAPAAITALAQALGTQPARLPARVERLGGGPRSLAALGADRAGIERAVEVMLGRAELRMTPDPPGADELHALVEGAW